MARPFASGGDSPAQPGLVVLPAVPHGELAAPVAAFRELLIRERHELETVLGGPIRFVDALPIGFAGPACLIGPAALNPDLAADRSRTGLPPAAEAVVEIERAGPAPLTLVRIDGPTLSDVGTALNLLWTAVRTGAARTVAPRPASPDAILDLVAEEVGATWPSFALRGLDWSRILSQHRDDVLGNGAELPSLQRLFARLGDAHTWARDPRLNARLPYRTWYEGGRLWLLHVPRWSEGWAAGARPGDELDRDTLDLSAWEGRISAVERCLPVVTGYRILAGAVGSARTLVARKPSGDVVRWEETYQPVPWREPMSWRRLPSGTGYLRVRGWIAGDAWDDALDAAWSDLLGCSALIVDLRGNVGGNLIAAQSFRDRFLGGRTHLGTIRFSLGDGALGEPGAIVGEPSSRHTPWTKPVRFLVDRECYSATEDALLGLHGLPHVQLVGEPTGGGSGRPRTIALDERRFFTVSTALTFDRNGRCIEGQGLAVDRPLPSPWAMMRRDIDPIAAADRAW